MADVLPRLKAALADRYQVERELGHGGMSTVYLAEDRKHHRQVAVKVLRAEVAAMLGADRFLREIETAARLTHPHILPLHESGEADDFFYYVMPYVEGESLRDRLEREQQLPLEEALQITREVAEALDYAHGHGVVHRDIKPENILLSEGHALVADFGLARALQVAGDEKLTQSGMAVGTPAYMSPEQASATANLDGRADLYSLGCVLYEMLAGGPPFTGRSAQGIAARHAVDPVPSLRTVRSTVPHSVERAITQAMAKVPADRFTTGAEFARALTTGVATLPVSHAEPRRRIMVLVGSAVLALAAAGVGVWVAKHRSPALDPRRVAVARFENRTGDVALDPLGDVAADYIARGLAETRLLTVVDARAEQRGDSSLQARQRMGDARALGRALGAGSVVWGSYYRRGDSLEFQAQLTDARTGAVIRPIQPAAGLATEPTRAVESLRQRVMAAFAARFDPQFAAFEGASQPTSYEAYQEFLAGEQVGQTGAECLPDCDGEALGHFRRAYALDSNFTLPLVRVAVQGPYGGDCARTDSIAEYLRRRHDRLPTGDRLSLDGAVATCHGERTRALELAREALAVSPQSGGAALLLGYLARRVGRLRETIALMEKLDPAKLDPARNASHRIYWGNLIIPYHLLGEHGRELNAAEGMRRAMPNKVEGISFQARALVGLGRLREMRRRLDEMLNVPTNVPQEATVAHWLDEVGRDLDAHGYPDEARGVFERAMGWCRSRPAEELKDMQDDCARAFSDAGHWDEARRIVAGLAAANPHEVEWQSFLGVLAAHTGNRREVERVDRWLAARKGPYLSGVPTLGRARLAAVLGDRERAVTLIRLAIDQGATVFGLGFGLHADLDFRSLRGYPPFEELLRPKA